MEEHKNEHDSDMNSFFKMFKKDTQNKKASNKGYLLGVYFPQKHLPLLKQKFLDIKHTDNNLEEHKALTKGYILGFQDRTKAWLAQLEQINHKTQSKEINKER